MRNIVQGFMAIEPVGRFVLAACTAAGIATIVMVLTGCTRAEVAPQAEAEWWQASPPGHAVPVHVACPGIAFDGWRDMTNGGTTFTAAGEVVQLYSRCVIIYRKAKPLAPPSAPRLDAPVGGT